MTLGGLAIAIGGLVDDAVVGIENVLRRLRENRQNRASIACNPRELVAQATMEVRSAILYATVIIVLVFVPLFALPGMEGRLFVPLGIAFIVSTLASLVVSVSVTPVMAYYLLPRMRSLEHGDTRFLAWLKRHYRNGLHVVLARPRPALVIAGVAVIVAAAAVPFLPQDVPAAIQRRHAPHRPSFESGGDTVRDRRRRAAGRIAPEAGS